MTGPVLLRRLALLLALALLSGGGPLLARAPAPAIPEVAARELPREARDTLALIRNGGPFPFERDGTVFQNRERLLPARERGYYRSYTVITPGARNRGTRRIVAGGGGERYYTEDHYASFRRIRE